MEYAVILIILAIFWIWFETAKKPSICEARCTRKDLLIDGKCPGACENTPPCTNIW